MRRPEGRGHVRGMKLTIYKNLKKVIVKDINKKNELLRSGTYIHKPQLIWFVMARLY
jgi:hypothetical protein